MSEAFVYCWTDHGRNMLYIGAHKGSPDGRYVCSSDSLKKEKKARPQDFTRSILREGTWKEMYVFETWLLGAVDARNNPQYYNMHNNEAPFFHQGPQSPEHIENHAATLRGKKQTPEHIEKCAATKRGRKQGPQTSERRANIAAALSRDYQIGFPDGHEAIIRNIRAFCRAHGLNSGAMVQVSKGRQTHHKGFRCRKLE